MIRHLLWFVALGLLSVACTQTKNDAQITLQLPYQSKNSSASSSGGGEIEAVIVNVSSAKNEFPLRDYEFDCAKVNCSRLSIEEIPSGYQRLIQLLILTKGSNETTELNYGDVLADLTSGENEVEINLKVIGSFANEAQWTGRYIPSVGHALSGRYLTGEVSVHAKVASDRPDMRIGRFEIFGGWFRAFLIDSIGFKFLFNGSDSSGVRYAQAPIFNDLHDQNGLNMNNSRLAASSNRIVRYSSSSNYYDHRGDGVYMERNFETRIMGFFGANPNNAYLCADNISGNPSLNGSNNTSQICKSLGGDGTCSNYFSWSDITIAGAINGVGDVCLNVAQEQKIQPLMIQNRGDWTGFWGPFGRNSTNNNLAFTYNSSNYQFRWNYVRNLYLPNGFEIFARNTTWFDFDLIEDRNDGYRCELLKNHGFESMGVFTTASGNFTLPSRMRSNNVEFAICPKASASTYYRTVGVTWHLNQSNSSSVPLVEFQLYKDLTTIIDNFQFGGSGWSNSSYAELNPQGEISEGTLYVVVKNITAQNVDVQGMNVDKFGTIMTVHPAPMSYPAGFNACGSIPFSLAPAGQSGDQCVVAVAVSSSMVGAYSPGSSFYETLSVHAQIQNTTTYSHQPIHFIASTLRTFNFTATGVNLDFHAPAGSKSVKYVNLYNNDVSPWTLLPTSDDSGNVSYTNSCGGTISMGSSCIVRFVVDNTSGTISNGSNSMFLGLGSSSMMISTTIHTAPVVLSQTNIDFGTLTAAPTTRTVTVQHNNATDLTFSSGWGLMPNTPFIGSTTCAGSYTNAESCTISVDATYPNSPGQVFMDRVVLPYQFSQDFRGIIISTRAAY